MVLIERLLITLPVKVLADGVFLDVDLKVSGDIASCTASVVGRACLLPQASSCFHPSALLVIQALAFGCLHFSNLHIWFAG